MTRHTAMLAFFAFAAAVCAIGAIAAPPAVVTLTDDQVRSICASQGGCGVTPPGPLLCAFGQRQNATGTACEAVVCPVGQQLNPAGNGCDAIVWNGVCPGFANTRVLVMSWAAPTRLYTSSVGGFGVNDAVVVRFTTGSVSTAGSLPRIAAAEYGSAPSSRIATLSSKPCDFGPQPTLGAAGEGNSVTMVFALGTGNGFGYYPVLPLNTEYFLNMKNSPNSSCIASGACDMFVDLVKVGGL